MGVSLIAVEGLEELLVDGVEEVLFFRIAGLRDGGGFDGGVEAVERLEEGVAGEVLGRDRLDNFFDFCRDDVALKELVVVEDLAEDALGEEVLDEHLLDGGVGEARVDGLAAKFGEGGEAGAELRVFLVLGFENFGDAFGEFGSFFGELGDGYIPVDLVGLAVFEEESEDFDEGFGGVDWTVEGLEGALIEDGMVGRLEEDVGEGLALGELCFDFLVKLVVGVLGFPEAVDEGEVVDEGSIGAERLLASALESVLLYEVPTVGGGAFLEQVGECGAGVALCGVAVFMELGEGGVVGLDGGVRGFEGKDRRHWLP